MRPLRPINPEAEHPGKMPWYRAEMDAMDAFLTQVLTIPDLLLFLIDINSSINKDENPPEACVECGGDNNGNPMTDIGICVRCALKAPVERLQLVPEQKLSNCTPSQRGRSIRLRPIMREANLRP